MEPKLTYSEMHIILDALRDKYGPGYSDKPEIREIQEKLWMFLESEYRRIGYI